MPDLNFEIISSEVKCYAAIPTLSFKLQITNAVKDEEVYAAALRCQIMIKSVFRPYDAETKERLKDLFGGPERWDENIKDLLWIILSVPVPRFINQTNVEISIPCSEDQSNAAGKFFYGIKEGKIPLLFLFSGTLFYKGEKENLQVTQISWEKEAAYNMPVILWDKMMETHFPNCRSLIIRKDIFHKLTQIKTLYAFPTMEKCLESLADKALKTEPLENEK